MFSELSTAEVRKHFGDVISRVASGKESVILTRKGEAVAAIISMEELRLIRELEDKTDIEDAWAAHHEPEKNIRWEKLRKEL